MELPIPCICDPKPDGEARHGSDTVTFKDTLTHLEASTIATGANWADSDDDNVRSIQMVAIMRELYVLVGVSKWTVRDASNKPVPVSHSAVRTRILGNQQVAGLVGRAAVDLYDELVLLPLVRGASSFSPPTQTDESTSQKPSGSRQSQKPEKPSSISTIPTAGTETTSPSPDGVYTSSQSLDMAG